MKIGFQGAPGAYSEAAIIKAYGRENQRIGFEVSEMVFEALANKEIDLAVMPIENSIAGNVYVNMDLLLSQDVYAVNEIYLPIHHCLLGQKGARLDDIKVVFSHPVAIAQCRDFLRENQIKAIAQSDTAGSCDQLDHKNQGAIASSLCAQIYGLNILAESIQTKKNNITRFITLSLSKNDTNQEKTSLVFSASHKPGALLDCLEIFKEHKINLTRLESRPVSDNPFEYVFYVDFLGGLDDSNIQRALNELESKAHWIKRLGSYPKGRIL